jgi:hypothetical protein
MSIKNLIIEWRNNCSDLEFIKNNNLTKEMLDSIIFMCDKLDEIHNIDIFKYAHKILIVPNLEGSETTAIFFESMINNKHHRAFLHRIIENDDTEHFFFEYPLIKIFNIDDNWDNVKNIIPKLHY